MYNIITMKRKKLKRPHSDTVTTSQGNNHQRIRSHLRCNICCFMCMAVFVDALTLALPSLLSLHSFAYFIWEVASYAGTHMKPSYKWCKMEYIRKKASIIKLAGEGSSTSYLCLLMCFCGIKYIRIIRARENCKLRQNWSTNCKPVGMWDCGWLTRLWILQTVDMGAVKLTAR